MLTRERQRSVPVMLEGQNHARRGLQMNDYLREVQEDRAAEGRAQDP
jgi:hypothetical protein